MVGVRADDEAARIGAAVRAERLRLHWSMRELARAIGASQPFVSNVENGRIFPSVEMLVRLADALGVSTRVLLPASESTVVIRAARGMRRSRTRSESASRQLLPGGRLVPYRVELSPGETEPRSLVHDGEDFVYVVSGVVEALREGVPALRLGAGDSLWLDGTVPHRLGCSAEESARAVVLIVCAAPRRTSSHGDA